MALVVLSSPADDGAHASEVLPRLHLGNAAFSARRELLAAHAITHVVSLASLDGFGARFPDAFTYHVVDVEDARGARGALEAALPAAAAFIAAALAGDARARVLVHCHVGTSRSVAAVLFYMLAHCGATLRGALLRVMAARAGDARAPYTHPNIGFWAALVDAEVALRGGPPTLPVAEYLERFSTGRNLAADPAALAEER
jgi:atypical dual specificity phosphatase